MRRPIALLALMAILIGTAASCATSAMETPTPVASPKPEIAKPVLPATPIAPARSTATPRKDVVISTATPPSKTGTAAASPVPPQKPTAAAAPTATSAPAAAAAPPPPAPEQPLPSEETEVLAPEASQPAPAPTPEATLESPPPLPPPLAPPSAQYPVDLTFKSFKGMNLPWGLNKAGVSTFQDWLSTGYDEAVLARALDQIRSMGVRTVGVWLWLDNMLVKDATWGTSAYVTKWNPTFVAHWQNFLLNVVKPRDMELIVTVFVPGPGPYRFEADARVPVRSGPDLLGPGMANGDMRSGSGSIPDGWRVIKGEGSASWVTGGGPPNGAGKYMRLTSGSSGAITLASPPVPFQKGALPVLSADFKGDPPSTFTWYYDSQGKQIAQDFEPMPGIVTGADGWSTATWAGRQGNVPANAVKIGLAVMAPAGGKTINIGNAHISYGVRSPQWQSYIQAVTQWVGLYGSNTSYGPAIAAWDGIKEVYDGLPPSVTHDFLKDFYDAVKATGTAQPVGVDSDASHIPVWQTANLGWYTDVADFYSLHIYDDQGSIPNVASLDKPFIIGEAGADVRCPGGVGFLPCPGGVQPHLYDRNGSWNANALKSFYTGGQTAGARTVLAWSWVDNPTIAAHNRDGTDTPGQAGNLIRDWVNAAGGR